MQDQDPDSPTRKGGRQPTTENKKGVTTRVADLGGIDPDTDTTLKKTGSKSDSRTNNPDPDPNSLYII